MAKADTCLMLYSIHTWKCIQVLNVYFSFLFRIRFRLYSYNIIRFGVFIIVYSIYYLIMRSSLESVMRILKTKTTHKNKSSIHIIIHYGQHVSKMIKDSKNCIKISWNIGSKCKDL